MTQQERKLLYAHKAGGTAHQPKRVVFTDADSLESVGTNFIQAEATIKMPWR